MQSIKFPALHLKTIGNTPFIMKKLLLLAGSVVAMSLMSFATSTDNRIIEVKGNHITIKDTRKISEKDLKFLSENVAGWTSCDKQSIENQCNTRNETFPDIHVTHAKIEKIIAKYQ